jgi:hypothetical protein
MPHGGRESLQTLAEIEATLLSCEKTAAGAAAGRFSST